MELSGSNIKFFLYFKKCLVTCGEEISKLAVESSKKYHSSQSASNLSIYQNIYTNFSPKFANLLICF